MRVDYVANRPSQLAAAGLAHLRLLGHDVREVYSDSRDRQIDPETGHSPDWDIADPLRSVAGAEQSGPGKTRSVDVTIVNGYSTARLLSAVLRARQQVAILRSDNIDPGDGRKKLLKRVLFSYLLKRRWVFAAVGAQAADCLATLGVPRSRIVRMPYLLPAVLPEIAPTRAVDVAIAAKFNHREGGDLLVEAISTFRERYGPKHCITILGDGDLLDRGRLAELGCQVRGFVAYDEYVGVLASAKVLLHLPRVEPWGASVVEALALGTSVVASDATGAAKELASLHTCSDFVRLTSSAQDAPGELASMLEAWSPEAASRCARSTRSLFSAGNWEMALASALDVAASVGKRNRHP